MFFGEEIDRDGFVDLAPLPEYRRSTWLMGLPGLLFVLLAWNVDWRPRNPRRRGSKANRKIKGRKKTKPARRRETVSVVRKSA